MGDNTSKPAWKKWLYRLLAIVVVVLIIAGYFTYSFTYSEGNRAGVLIKFSKMGYIFKTYEGELNIGGMGNVPNVAQANQIWYFSVKDQAVADSLMNLEGRRVSLHYKQVDKTLPWNGNTDYYVDSYKLIGNQ